jgi:hypothetical protein
VGAGLKPSLQNEDLEETEDITTANLEFYKSEVRRL